MTRREANGSILKRWRERVRRENEDGDGPMVEARKKAEREGERALAAQGFPVERKD